MSFFSKAIVGESSSINIEMFSFEEWAKKSGVKNFDKIKEVAEKIEALGDNEKAILVDWLYSELIKSIMDRWLNNNQMFLWRPLPYVRDYGDKKRYIEKEFKCICEQLSHCDESDEKKHQRKDTFVALVMFLRNYSDLMFFVYKDVVDKLPLFDMFGRFTFYVPMYTIVEFLIYNINCFVEHGDKYNGDKKKEFWKLINNGSLEKTIKDLEKERNKSVHWRMDPNYGWGNDNPKFDIDKYVKYRKSIYHLLNHLNNILCRGRDVNT